ncbi:hypothetical protein TWF730_001482 [Orbilia blumenaviensis]|uniref:Uncharacterized protein n=1 Tax=Orbilia blumenaviensis TaxID=1796055 RepID=A0AAV9UMA2_9PEZI
MPNHNYDHLTIPSSPPLLPSSQLPLPTTTGQKRFLDIDPSSDDIPVFSSDDLPPKEVFENPYQAYTRPPARNVKRHRSGTVQSTTILKHRTEIAFLSSDKIDGDDRRLPSSSGKLRSQQEYSEGHHEDDEEANTSLSTIRPPASEPDLPSDALTDLSDDPQDAEANFIIQKAIENGSEVIDLSHLSLTRTPTDISSLSSLILQPKDSISSTTSTPALQKSTSLLRSSSGIDPTLSSPYTSLLPQIHLHLHHNSLTTLSTPLTSVRTITGLYLRKNLLRTLPDHISALTSLNHLSLGENLLAYLPFSLISLKHLRPAAGLSFFPNPFFTFEFQDLTILPKRPAAAATAADSDTKDPTDVIYIPKSAHAVKTSKTFIPSTTTEHFIYNFITSTPLSAFNELGQPVTAPLTTQISHPSQWPALLTKPGLKDTNLPLLSYKQSQPRRKCIESKFPTLQELCLRKIATDVMYTSLKAGQREESIYALLPEHLKRKVMVALEGRYGGGDAAVKRCTVCKAGYVMKGVEWVEFWEVVGWGDHKVEKGVEYTKSEVVDRLLKEVITEGDDEGKKEMVKKIVGMKWNRFLKRYLGRRREGRVNVVPLIREGCSWECGEVWMRERQVAEEEEEKKEEEGC